MARLELLADHEWLRRRYLGDQVSQRQIAVQAECSTSTVRRALEAAGIPTRSRGRRSRLRAVDAEQILRLVAAHGQAGAADELGIDPSTLYREVQRLGIVDQMRDAKRTHRRAAAPARAAAGQPRAEGELQRGDLCPAPDLDRPVEIGPARRAGS